jgi:hypothetical protein
VALTALSERLCRELPGPPHRLLGGKEMKAMNKRLDALEREETRASAGYAALTRY